MPASRISEAYIRAVIWTNVCNYVVRFESPVVRLNVAMLEEESSLHVMTSVGNGTFVAEDIDRASSDQV